MKTWQDWDTRKKEARKILDKYLADKSTPGVEYHPESIWQFPVYHVSVGEYTVMFVSRNGRLIWDGEY